MKLVLLMYLQEDQECLNRLLSELRARTTLTL